MVEEDPIEVTFDLTPEEWIEVALAHNQASPIYKKGLRDGGILFGALVVTLTLLSLLQGGGLMSLAWLLGGGLVGALFPRFVAYSHRKQYQKFAEEGIANGMFGTHRVRLLEDGMLDETDSYQWLTRWHAIDRIDDSEGAFMIYTGKNAFLPIPHSAFRDAATLRAFGDRFFALMDKGEGRVVLGDGDDAAASPARTLDEPGRPQTS